jgi:plastocyanin
VTGGPADTAYSDTFEERSAARPDLGERIHIVQMLDGHRFEPAQVRINVGDSIEWRNNSREPHTVTADPEMAADPAHVAVPEGADPFDSGEIAPGDSFVLTFDQPGIYHYICLPHEEHGMTGTIVVRDSGAEQGAAPRPAADEGAAPAPAAEEPAAGELPPEPPQDDRY